MLTEEEFEFNEKGLTSEEAAKRLAQYGRNELPETREPKWLLFLRQFWAPMPIMIWIAIIIEAAIQNFIDMGILLMIQFANASISFYESNKAGNAIAALKSSLKPTATCKRDDKWEVIDAAILVPGDTVLLGSGSAIPADCRVNDSEIDVDQAALTGESLPVTFYKGDSCKMGSTVVRGEVEVSKSLQPDCTESTGSRSDSLLTFVFRLLCRQRLNSLVQKHSSERRRACFRKPMNIAIFKRYSCKSCLYWYPYPLLYASSTSPTSSQKVNR